MEWYYTKDKKQVGPISQQDLIQKISVGEVSSNDYAWHEGVTDWQPISNFKELNITSGLSTTPQAPVPSSAPVSPVAPVAPSPYAPASSVNKTSGLAIASLCLGVGAFVVCGLLAIPAVICGHMALGEIRRSNDSIEGKPMAIIGLIAGYLLIALTVVVILIFTLIIIGLGAGAASQDYSYEDDFGWDEALEATEIPDTHSSSSDDPSAEEALPVGEQ